MCEDRADSDDLRGRILKNVLGEIEAEDAVALVGILFEYRIVLSKTFWSLLRQHTVTFPLEPLEPQAASIVVADLFGMDCDALFLSFRTDWSNLRNSPRTTALKARIESHEHVDRLQPWTLLP